MIDAKQKNILKITGALAVIIAIIVFIVIRIFPILSDKAISQNSKPNHFPESFTFYHLGANTPFDDGFIQKFDRIFGSNAMTRKTTLDLEIRRNAILSEKLPALNQLDQNLNGQANERVEHDTTLVTYRYFPEKTNFFQYVKLWYANRNLKPLMVDIKVDYNGRYLIDDIVKKYGPGEDINLQSELDSLLYWELEKDYLLVFKTRDRYGEDLYFIKIYYVNNMEALYLKEQENKTSPKPVFF